MRRKKQGQLQEAGTEKEEKKRGKRIWNKRKVSLRILWGIAGVLLLVVLGFVLYQWGIKPNKRYGHYVVASRLDRNDGADTVYRPFGGYILKYNRDGVSVIDGKGTILWTAAYNMQNPEAVTSGSFVAVADIGSRQLVVYNEKGSASEVDILSDILQISLSEQGEVAVLMQEEDSYRIRIIDPYAAGAKEKAEILTYVGDSGYALAIALSKDGAKLVTSYFQVNGAAIQTNLTFYSFNSYGQGANADRIVGIFPYENTLFSKLEFMDNNTVCAFGDDRAEVFSMKQKPDLMWEIEYGRVLRAMCNSEYVMILEESEEAGTSSIFRAYRKDGKKAAEKKVAFSAVGIGQKNDNYWIYSEKDCLILFTDGKVKFEGEFQESVQTVMAGSAGDQYFLITGEYIEEMKLKEKASE